MLLGFPSSTKNTPYFVNWDISLEVIHLLFIIYTNRNGKKTLHAHLKTIMLFAYLISN